MFNMRKSVNWTFIHHLQLLIVFGLLSGYHAKTISNKLPCKFIDSIDISDGVVQSNQSIIYDGVEFTPADYAEMDRVLNKKGEEIPAKPHTRGCLCNRKPCIRLCCPRGQAMEVLNGSRTCIVHEEANRIDSKLLHPNNTAEPASESFSFVNGRSCERMYMADLADDGNLTTKEGRILHEGTALEHHEYCVQGLINAKTNDIDWNLLVCFGEADEQPENIRFTILPICMLISVIFIAATLLVYAFVPKLRNLNGKCLICYLITLAIGYSILAWLQFIGEEHGPVCTTLALFAYFTLIASFLWLNVLNFDNWQSFELVSGFSRFSERKRFALYCLYGFGIPCILTILLYAMDQIDSIPEYLRPRFGQHSCFLHYERFTRFLFFYIPLGVLITLNIILFVLTAMRIRRVHDEATKLRSPEEKSRLRKSLDRKKETFTLYFRLFIIAGVSWSLEVVSFLVAPDSLVFIFSDMWNSLQGLLIFILLVLRRRVLRLIKEKWNGIQERPNQNESEVTNSNDSANYLRLNTISTQK